ncbi:unnamed protein product [Adineta steineri]|uniref:SLC41A/MgtE integral membrane domain-containing protein n=1 Tax=Adineta steineri TaxID=433720 RepID=A0A813UEW4_9BILA|nr:unnamed protein product [Adineta steineri]
MARRLNQLRKSTLSTHDQLTCSSSILSSSSPRTPGKKVVKGGIMIFVIIISDKCKINPDNIVTPIAASLGDITILSILASIGGFLFRFIDKNMCKFKIYIINHTL